MTCITLKCVSRSPLIAAHTSVLEHYARFETTASVFVEILVRNHADMHLTSVTLKIGPGHSFLNPPNPHGIEAITKFNDCSFNICQQLDRNQMAHKFDLYVLQKKVKCNRLLTDLSPRGSEPGFQVLSP